MALRRKEERSDWCTCNNRLKLPLCVWLPVKLDRKKPGFMLVSEFCSMRSVITHPPSISCWPMGRGSWPTGWTWWIGQPTGQQVDLGQLCYSSINNKLTWPIHQVPSTKKIKLVLFIKNDIIIACYKKKCHLYSFVLWIVDKLSPSLFLLPQIPPSSYPLCTIKQLSGLLFLEPISKGRLNQESRKCLKEW